MLLVNCPHCDQLIEVVAINCGIFRCGVLKNTMEQIGPHLCREECERLASENRIYGCGKPFRVVKQKAELCDYI